MREILFRGKRCYNGEWAYSRCPDGTLHSGVVKYDFIPETVGQFTGLCDKNGKMIFEGDILRKDGRKYIIKYYTTFAMYMLSCMPSGGGTNGMMTQIFGCDVIGNIYDNPELLGGADNG